MTANNPITDVLAAPLSPDWTVERLADQVLDAILAERSDELHEFVLGADATVDRQVSRLIRPFLACLATKSAAEAGTPANLYGGQFSFERSSPDGPVWIVGKFENRPGSVRVTVERLSEPRKFVEVRMLPSRPIPFVTPGFSSPPKGLEARQESGVPLDSNRFARGEPKVSGPNQPLEQTGRTSPFREE